MRIPPFSIRVKMTLAALVPLAFTLLLVWGAAFYLIDRWVVGETQRKVRQDLNAARAVLQHEEDRVADVVRFTSHGPLLIRRMQEGAPEKFADDLRRIRRREGLDILTLTDPDGAVLVRTTDDGVPGGRAPGEILRRGTEGNGFCGPILLREEELRPDGEELLGRARVPLRPPVPAGRPSVETRGMLLTCAQPVLDPGGKILGHLYGGVLLNGNLPLVDQIREIVYGTDFYRGTEIGSATLFLGDVRVATTVRLKGGERALGTRVSPEVAEEVLSRQQIWVARARVVDDWYLTAYEPILGPRGEAIGALYVGMLERPFDELKFRAALTLLVLLAVGGLLGTIVAGQIARRLSRPILNLEECARRVAAGERDVCAVASTRDEVGVLTATFNDMTAALREQDSALQELNRELEGKVRERTAELEEKSWQLIRTREELARSEKLAAIGSLAAGVAHEINNPAAIIRGNVEILLSELPEGDGRREEALEILKQTERISLITTNMLTFARRQTMHPEQIDLHALLDDVLAQVSHQTPAGRVSVRREYDPALPAIDGDRERLRQVFNNLILNALQAMNGEGTLSVETRLADGEAQIRVADTGPGIPAEVREKVFDPFFTTRRDGTGLGLSVSYGIVQALGGTLDVESEEGRGTTFTIRLPMRHG